jgi:hypothetical protein
MASVFKHIYTAHFAPLYDSDQSYEKIAKTVNNAETKILITLVFLMRVMRHPAHAHQFSDDPTGSKVIEEDLHRAFQFLKFQQYQDSKGQREKRMVNAC